MTFFDGTAPAGRNVPAERRAEPLSRITNDELREAIGRVGEEISMNHPDGVLLVGVLKGALMFLADLARAIDVPCEIDFVSISRYAPDSGRVRILKDLEADIAGRDTILVEDIVDTGLTAAYLLESLRSRSPRSLEMCTLLDRSRTRIVPLDVRYRCFEIGDEFFVGYGLDHAERYRNLSELVAVDVRVLQADPDAYLATLYGI